MKPHYHYIPSPQYIDQLKFDYIETKALHHINADSRAYELMREFFIDIGHPVESKNRISRY
jgi:hypothetical protein